MLVLVLGGARSGKSAFAQRLATESGRRVLYVGTASPSDPEMAARISRHQQDRPEGWRTVEIGEQLEPSMLGASERETVLLDGLGVWVTSAIGAIAPLAGGIAPDARSIPPAAADAIERPIAATVMRFADWARDRPGLTIIVSEEVGWGLVPPYPLGRLFRDILGRANQALAGTAACTYLVVAGIGVDLSRLAAVFADGQANQERN